MPYKPETFLPKGAVCEKQCDSCPFLPSQEKVNAAGVEYAKQSAQMGTQFFCHGTVYTGRIGGRKKPRSEWKECLGAVKHRDAHTLMLRKQHTAKKPNT